MGGDDAESSTMKDIKKTVLKGTGVPFTVIALDPGITTGYAEGWIKDGKLNVVSGQAKWNHLDLWQHLHNLIPNYVISERFVYRQVRPGTGKAQTGIELYSREMIGVANLYCQVNGDEFVLQNVMKDSPTTFFNNARLRSEGFYKTGNDHAMDAVRHLLYWFQFGQGFKFNKHGYVPAS